jgi:hypothetical protein
MSTGKSIAATLAPPLGPLNNIVYNAATDELVASYNCLAKTLECPMCYPTTWSTLGLLPVVL